MTYDGLRQATARIRSLGAARVLVGIPSENAERKPEDGEPVAANNALLGYVHEFGSPAKNIPARPFLIPGVQDAQPQIVAQLDGGVRSIMNGGAITADQMMHRVGIVAQNSVRARITNGPHAPLSQRTLDARLARGRTGERPLIDTGQMRRAVTYVVEGS